MTKVAFHNIPFINSDDFLTPFDKVFDTMVENQFPEIIDQVGVKPYQGTAYPKVNVYEYDDKVGIVAEIVNTLSSTSTLSCFFVNPGISATIPTLSSYS